MTSDPNQQQQRSYRCVHCMQPSSTTYRKISKTEIKLTTCTKCGDDVDPYVERDWLLVVMDCILLREEAYRHVLCNNSALSGNNNNSNSSSCSSGGMSYGTIFQYLLACSILQGYLLIQENPSVQQLLLQQQQRQSSHYDTTTTTNPPSLLFVTLLVEILLMGDNKANPIQWWIPLLYVAVMTIGNLLLLMGIQFTFAWLKHRNISTGLFFALILPPILFYGIFSLLVVVIWENSIIVRRLSHTLVLYYQSIISIISMELQLSSSSTSSSQNTSTATTSRFPLLLIFGMGILVRAIGLSFLRWIISSKYDDHNMTMIPCLLGFDFNYKTILSAGFTTTGQTLTTMMMNNNDENYSWTVCLC